MASAAFWQDRSSMRRLLAGASVLLVLGGCRGTPAEPAPEQPAIAVRAAEVMAAGEVEPLRFAGLARARQRASLTFQVGGTLATRPLTIGQRVQAGEVLATLYNPQLAPARDAAQARLTELQVQAAQARRDLARSEQLFQRGVLSQADLEQHKARLQGLDAAVRSAGASLQQSEQLHSETRLRAPFDGTIDALLVEAGEYVAAGQPVLQLAAGDGLEVEVMVPAELLQGLEAGMSVPVWASLEQTQWQGRVVEIGRGAGYGSALYPLVVSLEGQGRAGDALEVGLQRRSDAQLGVPLAAVMRSAQGLSVFRLEQGLVQRVSVQVSGFAGELAMLSEGDVRAGDRVVYAGLGRLADGDAVELLP